MRGMKVVSRAHIPQKASVCGLSSSSWPHLVQLVRNVRTRSRLVESGQEHLKFPCLRIIWT